MDGMPELQEQIPAVRLIRQAEMPAPAGISFSPGAPGSGGAARRIAVQQFPP
jgi:hypothetical protein